jgi:hypothetical protein
MAKSEHDKRRDELAKDGGQTAPIIEQALAEQANNDAYGIEEGGAAKRLAAAGHVTQASRDEAAATRKAAAAGQDDDAGKAAKARHTPPAGRTAPRDRQDRA